MIKQMLELARVVCITVPLTWLAHNTFGAILGRLHATGLYFPSGLISGWKEFHFGLDLILFPIFAALTIGAIFLLRWFLWKKRASLSNIFFSSIFLMLLWWIFVQPGILRYIGRSIGSQQLIMWWGLEMGQGWLSVLTGFLVAGFITMMEFFKNRQSNIGHTAAANS